MFWWARVSMFPHLKAFCFSLCTACSFVLFYRVKVGHLAQCIRAPKNPSQSYVTNNISYFAICVWACVLLCESLLMCSEIHWTVYFESLLGKFFSYRYCKNVYCIPLVHLRVLLYPNSSSVCNLLWIMWKTYPVSLFSHMALLLSI